MTEKYYVCADSKDSYNDPVVFIGKEARLKSGLVAFRAIATALYSDNPEMPSVPEGLILPTSEETERISGVIPFSKSSEEIASILALGETHSSEGLKQRLTSFAIKAYQNNRTPGLGIISDITEEEEQIFESARIATEKHMARLIKDQTEKYGLYL